MNRVVQLFAEDDSSAKGDTQSQAGGVDGNNSRDGVDSFVRPDTRARRSSGAEEFWATQLPKLNALRIKHSGEVANYRRANFYERSGRSRDDDIRPGFNDPHSTKRGGYKRLIGTIKLTKAGEVKCDLPGVEISADEFEDEISKARFPKSAVAPLGSLPDALKNVDPSTFDIFPTPKGDGVCCIQQRFDFDDGRKAYVLWSYLVDDQGRNGEWQKCEPDGDLPIYNLHLLNDAAMVFLHEGAKAARHCQWMVEGKAKEARDALAAHPWGDTLSAGVHLGWIGGAPNPHRTDWDPLKQFTGRLIIICDNDRPGINAAPKISKILQRPISRVRFDKRFNGGFDLADEFPQHKDFWTAKKEYKGPTLADLASPATWATEEISTGRPGPKLHVIRQDFADEWVSVVKPAVFINLQQPHILHSEDQANTLVRPFSHIENTMRLVRADDASQARGLVYKPGEVSGALSVDGQLMFNMHRPSNIKSKGGSQAPWLGFMEYLFPVEFDRHEIKRWCATLIARPGNRMEYALLLISEKHGVGKSTLCRILAAHVGKHNTSFPSESAITNSNFNDWGVNRRLVVVNEIYAGANHKAYDQLKPYITDEYVDVNKKYIDPYTVECWAHIIACSNSFEAIKLVDDDRRWLVPLVVEEKRPKEYWQEFNAWLDDDGMGIIRQWADEFLVEAKPVMRGENSPMTDMKKEVIAANQSPGLDLAFDIGQVAMKEQEWTVIGQDDLLRAIASWRGLSVSDFKMDKKRAILKKLKAAGMFEASREPGKDTPRFKFAGRNGGSQHIVSNRPVPIGKTVEDLRAAYEAGRKLLPERVM